MGYQINSINKLQVPTWSWLHINDTSVSSDLDKLNKFSKDPILMQKGQIICTNQLPVSNIQEDDAVIISDIKEYVKSASNNQLYIEIPEGVTVADPIIIDYGMDDENNLLINDTLITVGENSYATIVIKYSSTESEVGLHSGYTSLILQKNANIKLIQLQAMDKNHSNTDAVNISVSENANIDVIMIEMGAKKTVSGCNIILKGESSTASLDSIYIGDGDREIDLNYRIAYEGANTQGNIIVKGMLTEQSKKVCKSTLDFIAGAVNARGREAENVMILSPSVVNISSPLLLCGEDNVEGEHATSVGSPDKNKLFYIKSRGFDEREAKKLMVEASFSSILDKIQLQSLREDVIEQIRKVVHYA